LQNKLRHIKNIIFDLGGVIINLDTELTIYEFNKLSDTPFESVYTQKQQIALFNQFDKGEISDYDFFKTLREILRFTGEDEDLLYAWNAMLLGVPDERLDVLIKAKQNYKTFLLSNTNETHVAAFERDLYQTQGVRNFKDYFDKVYYSCRMKMRKPDKEIFEFVLTQNRLNPSETVFIDDSVQHVKGAGECGINAYLLRPAMEIGDLLKELNLL
jgi:putative hydrolase of the HAD superfamily